MSEYKKVGEVYALRIKRGEELLCALKEFCEKEKIFCGVVSGLGAADCVTVGAYNVSERKYYSNTTNAEVELCSITGNISEKDGEVYLHVHVTFASVDGIAHGGHLNRADISATCELIVKPLDGRIGRFADDETGLNLMKF